MWQFVLGLTVAYFPVFGGGHGDPTSADRVVELSCWLAGVFVLLTTLLTRKQTDTRRALFVALAVTLMVDFGSALYVEPLWGGSVLPLIMESTFGPLVGLAFLTVEALAARAGRR